MKNLLLFIAFMLYTSISFSAPIETTTKGSIGRKSLGCRGLGLCLSNSFGEAKLTIHLSYDNVTSTLIISIDELDILGNQPNVIHYFRDKQSFTLEEDVILSRELVSKLKLTTDIISKGSFPLIYQDGKYRITIKR